MASMKIIPQVIITTHILHRLPAKSVGRFRCVSKVWLSLLTDPRFIQTHQKTLDKSRHFILESCNGSLYSVSLYKHEVVSTQTNLDLETYRINYILGSSNGLVLVQNKDSVLLVLNPTTKDYVELPSPEFRAGITGFGYDSVSDDYKVVVISVKHNYVNVYSLRTNTSKLVSHSPYYYYKSWWGVLVNGFVHWIGAKKYPSKPVIVAFSLADEKLRELQLPNSYHEVDIKCYYDTKLVALGEKLAIFNEVRGDVWLMNEYGVHKSWTEIVVHGFNEIPMARPEFFYDNGKILFLTCELLSIYDVEKESFCKSTDISNMNLKKVMGAYVESLVSQKFSKPS